MRVAVTGPFRRTLKRLASSDQSDVLEAIKAFQQDPAYAPLNFEQVKNRRTYHTIRANFSVRILLRRVSDGEYELVAVGNHDFIYATYFQR